MNNSVPVSILVSTYRSELASRLLSSLESIINQTSAPQEIVLVIDGPIDDTQEEVIQKYLNSENVPKIIIRRLNKNSGLANALNYGLAACSNDIIARMDSDDIAQDDRIEKQYQFLQKHPEIDVVASWQAEFEDDDIELITTVKETPPNHQDIVRSLKWRNVVSHPTIMFRKAIVMNNNGYDSSVGLLEDYDLHMRLIKAGARYAAIQEPLVKVRISKSQRSRRGGISYMFREGVFRYRCYKRGNYSFWIFIASFTSNALFRIMPAYIKGILYRFVRKSIEK